MPLEMDSSPATPCLDFQALSARISGSAAGRRTTIKGHRTNATSARRWRRRSCDRVGQSSMPKASCSRHGEGRQVRAGKGRARLRARNGPAEVPGGYDFPKGTNSRRRCRGSPLDIREGEEEVRITPSGLYHQGDGAGLRPRRCRHPDAAEHHGSCQQLC